MNPRVRGVLKQGRRGEADKVCARYPPQSDGRSANHEAIVRGPFYSIILAVDCA